MWLAIIILCVSWKSLHNILWFVSGLYGESFLPLLLLLGGKLRGDQFGAGMGRTDLTPRSIWGGEGEMKNKMVERMKKIIPSGVSLFPWVSLSPSLSLSLSLSLSPTPFDLLTQSTANYHKQKQFTITNLFHHAKVMIFTANLIHWSLGEAHLYTKQITTAIVPMAMISC